MEIVCSRYALELKNAWNCICLYVCVSGLEVQVVECGCFFRDCFPAQPQP